MVCVKNELQNDGHKWKCERKNHDHISAGHLYVRPFLFHSVFLDFQFAHQLVFVREHGKLFLKIWIRNVVVTNEIVIRINATANKNVKWKQKENDNWECREWCYCFYMYIHVMLFSHLFYIRISIFFSLLFLMSYWKKREQRSFSVIAVMQHCSYKNL